MWQRPKSQPDWRDKTWAEIVQYVKAQNEERVKRQKAEFARDIAAVRARNARAVNKYEYTIPGNVRDEVAALLRRHRMRPLPPVDNTYNGNSYNGFRYIVPNNPEYTRAALALLVKGLRKEWAAVKPRSNWSVHMGAHMLIPRRTSVWRSLLGVGQKPSLSAKQLAARNSAILARRRRRAASARK
jgi:hypothetical protein